MDKLIKRLAYTRNIEAEYKQELADVQAEIEASYGPILKRVKGLLEVAQADVADAETDVRKAALKAFEESGEKQVHPTVTVKMFTVLEYDDGEAVEYSRQHLPTALKLDRRTFEKAAKVLDLVFVTQCMEPKPTIARDLSAYLE